MDNGNLQHRRGFTLIEMAVVLVIIGLLVAGLVVGRSMLITSRLQSVITDADNYITATTNFRQTYQALPGDMASATTIWGTDSNGCPSGGGATGTCNGNGDGEIGSSVNPTENFRYWQHLYYAGMFSQKLPSPLAGSNGSLNAVIGINSPASSITGAGWYMTWMGTLTSNANYYNNGFYGHVLQFGNPYWTGSNNGAAGPAITADQANSIDSKIDDGVPSSGKVRAPKYNANITTTLIPGAIPCTTSGGVYNTSSSGNSCWLLFLTGF